MQHLEVSGAVRPLKWSLGVKRVSSDTLLFPITSLSWFSGLVA